jgi:glutaredoxin 3
MVMAKVEIYTTFICPYCHAAKDLLSQKGAAFSEVNLNKKPNERETMIARAKGGKSVPQIFINDQHIGGCDDLYALDAADKLDKLLAE